MNLGSRSTVSTFICNDSLADDMKYEEYLLDLKHVDMSEALVNWQWLLPEKFKILMGNQFADLFLLLENGKVAFLNIGYGRLTKVVDRRDYFRRKLNKEEHAKYYLMVPMVDILMDRGARLKPGECYGFKLLPAMGGSYWGENCLKRKVEPYLNATGIVHREWRKLPEGAKSQLDIEKF